MRIPPSNSAIARSARALQMRICMQAAKVILSPVDFSKGSDRAVEQAAILAKALGANVELLHVYQLPALALPDGVMVGTTDFAAKLRSHAHEALDLHRERLAVDGVHASCQLIEGSPLETILARAKESGASMIVLGTHGRSGFKRFALGSTAEAVVRHATVPVLTVHLAE
jgi:nucleotide-binding universal stress UspA family protein